MQNTPKYKNKRTRSPESKHTNMANADDLQSSIKSIVESIKEIIDGQDSFNSHSNDQGVKGNTQPTDPLKDDDVTVVVNKLPFNEAENLPDKVQQLMSVVATKRLTTRFYNQPGLDNTLNNGNIRLRHLNICGWTQNDKDLRTAMLEEVNVDIFNICETHLKEIDKIEVNGYSWKGLNRQYIHRNTPKASGGIGLLIKKWIFEEYNYETIDITRGCIICGSLKDYSDFDELPLCPSLDKTVNQHGNTFLECLNESKMCVLKGRFNQDENNFTFISRRGKSVDKDGEIVSDEKVVLGKWKTNFQNIYNMDNSADDFDGNFQIYASEHKNLLEERMLDPLLNENEELNSAITKDEIRRLASRTKHGKSCGIDNIP
ncbi:unnamed protein product [Mytilus coruscus]|uniref:Endonuclease/exonuclease/phosphatase domain-containing protein n=1 Tax=Mytilus coruscus TaxID=42192 RepID=A0A6J8A3N5_MYTCO|nr:unnamed protein product [Mytilus coruscus]